ncbi:MULTISPECIES: dihydrolipoyl dehydrogenase [Chromobacterium]|uniref:Dihydrolipoyl dehydrogenase n=1 Tax=Chromobacterium rhizoryzae TaxID=1778675 RepID=A0AAD0W9M4_9NEIS|nr:MULTISPECIES: dihydrolipoyl dehydrogenase [Chromobacterium]AXT48564.1 dihydrolipoyl dehydrogenase [Chromobacterium rhizoryzae]OQS37005.1 dihydrolipoyl dehydrogenase [Chromobacterium haemolyticum]OQS43431.1 dihydrolipoyl dehydrogenase [Chromobacterium haemolyticum]PTU69852.1 dihydrolipoyl dehydrogenase [Chromobacterium haemolyticum]QOD82543.1 dihydrolipoyl dehydrogenase [Chromobacterium haemolyticum]
MSNLIELKVPDIGGHNNVDVIEVFVKPGDVIAKEASLITLETDKATMEVPAEAAGTVKEVRVAVGGKVSEGDVIVIVEAAGAAAAAPAAPKPVETTGVASATTQAGFAPQAAPVAASHSGGADVECDVMVLGGGPGGYSAAFRAADLGLKVVIVERYSTLGGVCLNVGCIPSKALLHNAAVIDEVSHLAANGIKFGKPEVDIDMLRGYKEKVIAKLTGGLAGMAKARKVEIVRGNGRFIDPHHIEVSATTGKGREESGEKKIVKFKNAIIAAGSRVVKLPFIPDDPRVVDSTGALELKGVANRMLIIGGGIIGLEMGTVYSTLGARLDVVEMMDGLMQGADRDLVKVWQKWNAHRFDNIMLNTKTVAVEPKDDGVWVTFEGDQAPKEPQRYDLVLYATGRAPNGKLLGAENAGIAVTDRGFIPVDKQQRTNVPHIFAIGDIVGQPMLAHKGVHEGHVAAENCAGQKSYFDARVIPGVAYTDPEVAWVGVTEDEAKKQGLKIEKGVFPWAASGRAIANGRDEGFTKLIFDAESHQIIGGGIVGPHAGDMIGEVCLAIEMGCDATDIGKTIHPHPTMGESIGMAAEVAHGTCTDLPPQRKK